MEGVLMKYRKPLQSAADSAQQQQQQLDVQFYGSPHTAQSQGIWNPDGMTWKSSLTCSGSAREDVSARRASDKSPNGDEDLSEHQLAGRLEETERAVLAVVEASRENSLCIDSNQREGNGEDHERGRGRSEPRETRQAELQGEPNTFWERALAFSRHEVGTSPTRSRSSSLHEKDEGRRRDREREHRLREATKAHFKIQQALDQATLHRRVEELGMRVEEEGRLRREAEAARAEAECRLVEFQKLLLDERRKGDALLNSLKNPKIRIAGSSEAPTVFVAPPRRDLQNSSDHVESPSRQAGADEAGGGANEADNVLCRKAPILQRILPPSPIGVNLPLEHELTPPSAGRSAEYKENRGSTRTAFRGKGVALESENSASGLMDSLMSNFRQQISFDNSSGFEWATSRRWDALTFGKSVDSKEAFPSVPPSSLRALASARNLTPPRSSREHLQPKFGSRAEVARQQRPRFQAVAQPRASSPAFRASSSNSFPSRSRAHTPHSPSPSVSPSQHASARFVGYGQTPGNSSTELQPRVASRSHTARKVPRSPPPYANVRSPSRSQEPSSSHHAILRTPSPDCQQSNSRQRPSRDVSTSRSKLWPHSTTTAPSPISARLRSARGRTGQWSRETS